VLRDLAEITHWISVIKITPEAAEDPTVSPDERTRGQAMAAALPMRVMTRMWQMLLKALEEVAMAPNAMMAAEMAIIRLTHVADLPTPGELVKKLQDTTPPPAPTPAPGGGQGGPAAAPTGGGGASLRSAPSKPSGGAPTALAVAQPAQDPLERYARFEDVVELIRTMRDVKLLVEVETGIRLVSYTPGRIEFQPTDKAPHDLAQRLGQRLQGWTGARWAVTLVNEGGAATVAEVRDADQLALEQEALEHPLVKAVLETFPGAKITKITTPKEIEETAAAEALPEVADEWDPFEDE
ncbi:MAG TPA: DNA polymerase III subunit gamma/tau, partial [Rhodobacteraceae bacterium]|nr:DNA polymerase III subunit gamma/tau [Paracoccaceae bacterium]